MGAPYYPPNIQSQTPKIMSLETSFTKCTNCKQSIGSDKLDLHQSYCFRFNIFCQLCESVYDKQTQPDHPEIHQKELCKICEKEFEKRQLQSHSKKCRSEHICPYCELSVKKELANHVIECGSRTDTCQVCKVPYKKSGKPQSNAEADLHVTVCAGYQSTPVSSKRSIFESSISEYYEESEKSETISAKSKFQRYLKNKKKQNKEEGEHEDIDENFRKPKKNEGRKKIRSQPQQRFIYDLESQEYDVELNEILLKSMSEY